MFIEEVRHKGRLSRGDPTCPQRLMGGGGVLKHEKGGRGLRRLAIEGGHSVKETQQRAQGFGREGGGGVGKGGRRMLGERISRDSSMSSLWGSHRSMEGGGQKGGCGKGGGSGAVGQKEVD